jgi:inorganic phosphate transporter, PiT family
MTEVVALFAATLFLSYANGANDNFKGVATLYGSNVASYRSAILLATCTTFAGSLASPFLAQNLMVAFSGKGLVPDVVIASPIFALSVAIGAAGTVMIATLTGFPISTTHALVGAITGAGFCAIGTDLELSNLSSSFLAPLAVSPILAVCATIPLYWALHRVRVLSGFTTKSCICVGPGRFVPMEELCFSTDGSQAAAAKCSLELISGTTKQCFDKYDGLIFGISLQSVTDAIHCVSAGAISFARGLNDTPKIVGLLFVVQALNIKWGVGTIATAMAIGGLLNAQRVAHTMSKRVTGMNDGQALTANLVTATLVIFASKLSLPVSTTHASVGAIAGIGIVGGSADWRVVSNILISWALTLPIAAIIAAFCYAIIGVMR